MTEIKVDLIASEVVELEVTKRVLAERMAELLERLGPCRAPGCVLHLAHRGPCNVQ